MSNDGYSWCSTEGEEGVPRCWGQHTFRCACEGIPKTNGSRMLWLTNDLICRWILNLNRLLRAGRILGYGTRWRKYVIIMCPSPLAAALICFLLAPHKWLLPRAPNHHKSWPHQRPRMNGVKSYRLIHCPLKSCVLGNLSQEQNLRQKIGINGMGPLLWQTLVVNSLASGTGVGEKLERLKMSTRESLG